MSRVIATLKRLVDDGAISMASAVTILLATVLLASGPVYADAVTLGALRQTIAEAPANEATLNIEINIRPTNYAAVQTVVDREVGEAFESTGAETFAYAESEPFGFIETSEADLIDILKFSHIEGIDQHARLSTGSWPVNGGLEVAVNRTAAEAKGIRVGDTLSVESRLDDSLTLDVLVVGLFEPIDTSHPLWADPELVENGFTASGSFRTLGPFVVTYDSLASEMTTLRITAGWRVIPEYDNLSVAGIPTLRGEAEFLDQALNDGLVVEMSGDTDGSSEYAIATGINRLLSGVDRSLTVTRSSVLALLVQLSLLAGYALALTASLVVSSRRTETRLMRARGASPGQITSMSIIEGLFLVIPIALAAPFIGSLLLELINRIGPIADSGLSIRPAPTPESFLVSGVAALMSLALLTWPAYDAAKDIQGEASHRRRQLTKTGAQRARLDIALVVLSVVAFWQLQTLGADIGARVRGRLGIDPLLVVAPALGLVAGSVLALRIVPLLARAGEWVANAVKGTVAALTSWQIARRPVRYARASLLLMMAVGIGFFTAAYSTTWRASQIDQANYATGADLAVRPNTAVARSVSDLHLAAAHESLEGVNVSMPVRIWRSEISRTGQTGNFVALDATKAADVVRARTDLAPDFASLMTQLSSQRPELGGLEIPGQPDGLSILMDAQEIFDDESENGDNEEGEFRPPRVEGFRGSVRLVIQDGEGLIHRFTGRSLGSDDGLRRIVADFRFARTGADPLLPSYPIRLINIEIESPLPPDADHLIAVSLHKIESREGGVWSQVPAQLDWSSWTVGTTQVIGAFISPSIKTAPPVSPGVLTAEVNTGRGFGVAPTYLSLRPAGSEIGAPIPIVVTTSFLENSELKAGDEIRMPGLGGRNTPTVIVGSIDAFPTLDPDSGDVIIADLASIGMETYRPGPSFDRADEYWLSIEQSLEDSVVEALLSEPFLSTRISSRADLGRDLLSDPVALGTVGALSIGFIAAAALAAVGFAVSATVSARERLIEIGLVRALGLSPRQLATWLLAEQGLLVGVSILLGTGIGYLLTATILPVIALTQDGEPAMPAVLVSFPWRTVFTMELVIVAVLAIVVAILGLALKNSGLGSLLRMGEDS